MKFKFCLCICLIASINAKNQDPFHPQPTAVIKRASVLKKYRYHGYLKLNQRVFAILKMVGSDYELVRLGLHKGLGQVIRIEASRICIRKSGKNFCLSRSDVAKTWEVAHV